MSPSQVHEIVCSVPRLQRLDVDSHYSHPREATEEELTKSVWLKGHAGRFSRRNLGLTIS